jgi:hypothetical protein
MWYAIFVTLVVDIGGLLVIYAVLRDRLQRAASAQAQVAEIREEVSRLLVELNQVTDRNLALMEDKVASLNDALSTADKKIGLLRREIEKHDVGSQIYSRLAEGRPRPVPPPAAAQMPEPAPAPRPAEEREPPPALAVELSEKPTSAGAAAAGSAPDLRERVMMLHRAGFSLSLIASRVGAPLGEVELIVSLEQRKGQA